MTPHPDYLKWGYYFYKVKWEMGEESKLGMLVMRTESKLKGATFADIKKSMRARAKEASKSECTRLV